MTGASALARAEAVVGTAPSVLANSLKRFVPRRAGYRRLSRLLAPKALNLTPAGIIDEYGGHPRPQEQRGGEAIVQEPELRGVPGRHAARVAGRDQVAREDRGCDVISVENGRRTESGGGQPEAFLTGGARLANETGVPEPKLIRLPRADGRRPMAP